jgi:hypothetical protein
MAKWLISKALAASKAKRRSGSQLSSSKKAKAKMAAAEMKLANQRKSMKENETSA